jgi:hypothetical protein
VPALQLTLTIDEINLALEALGQMPFSRVHQLIANIQQQATAQLQAGQAADDNRTTPTGQSDQE